MFLFRNDPLGPHDYMIFPLNMSELRKLEILSQVIVHYSLKKQSVYTVFKPLHADVNTRAVLPEIN